MIRYCPHCATPVEERWVGGRLRPACPACNFVAFADPKVSATVLIERAGALLLIRRSIDPGLGLWCFPGGYVDYGEDPVVAATRECHEEAGIVVDDLRLLDVAFNGRVIVITYHTTTFFPAEPVPGDDADMAAWFVPPHFPPFAFPATERTIMIWQREGVGHRAAARYTKEG
ncbi:MAG TPA: NUDIX domain-containing protein [Herpetosiphonaceae bacterium]|nr:NUDIX domain-containing protein [Herpetosiphonaceae bacterium]